MSQKHARKYLAFTLVGLQDFEKSEVVNHKYYSNCVESQVGRNVVFRHCPLEVFFAMMGKLKWISEPGVYDHARKIGEKLNRSSIKVILHNLTDSEILLIQQFFSSFGPKQSEILGTVERDMTLLVRLANWTPIMNFFEKILFPRPTN